ncbi:hypothetical protein CL614_09110 [archaeon]|nr:hypothetical protein [archaeon]
MSKKKILVLSDHALSTSGVGTQTRHLINGLLARHPGEWTFRQFGAALKHTDYDTTVVNEDFIIKPIDGFGDRDLIRITLATEKPDILLIFTDPRFFIWLFEMEDEIHQVCPIIWWHVWDNHPFPEFNNVLYKSTDVINCHSYMTYEMVKEKHPNNTNFIPHSLPQDLFFPMQEDEIKKHKINILGYDKKDDFVAIWVNRNAKRKRPNDALLSWKLFLDKIEKKTGCRDATLLMHTDPYDHEGPNLVITSECLGINENVVFSNQRLDFDKMNILYNISDVCFNISYAEGFGLPTLEAMQAGIPIIALKTGGLTRQVVDHRDGSENGIALDVECRTLVGSQQVPYIYEDYVNNEAISDAFYKLYNMESKEIKSLGEKARQYALSEFSHDKTVDMWHHSLLDLHQNWKKNYKSWQLKTY